MNTTIPLAALVKSILDTEDAYCLELAGAREVVPSFLEV